MWNTLICIQGSTTRSGRVAAEWESLDHRLGHIEDNGGRALQRNRLREIFSDGRDYGKKLPDVLGSLNSLVLV